MTAEAKSSILSASMVAPLVLLLLLFVVYWPALADLARDWYIDPNYSHGFLIMPVAAYLFYRDLRQLPAPKGATWWGTAILLCGLALLLLGTAASEYFVLRFSFVVCLCGLAVYFLGLDGFKKCWFAFFFLLFMIPIPAVFYYAATMPMQLLASKTTTVLLHIVGIPAARSGNIIVLPNYRLEVAEACSGLRSLVTLLAMAALFAKLVLPGIWRPLVLFVAAFPIAIVVNVVRVFFTAFGAYAISPKLADQFLHQVSGMLVFGVALILIIGLGGLLRWTTR